MFILAEKHKDGSLRFEGLFHLDFEYVNEKARQMCSHGDFVVIESPMTISEPVDTRTWFDKRMEELDNHRPTTPECGYSNTCNYVGSQCQTCSYRREYRRMVCTRS